MRNNRFGFKLTSDPQENIKYIIDNNLHQNNTSLKNFLLGELYLELGETDKAKEKYKQIEDEKLQATGFLIISYQNDDYNSFKTLLPKAFPESYTPETHGRYILSFLIGNERSFQYNVDEKGIRSVSFVYSTGVIKVLHIDIFSAFIFDNRLSPDGRIGLWLSPKTNFINEDVQNLDYKEVLGWKDIHPTRS